MPYAQIDDHFHDSEAALRAGPEPLGLYLLSVTWCSAHLTDGHLPEIVGRGFIDRCADGDALVARLVEAGLWETADDGFEDGWRLPHFFDGGQRTREQVEADKAKKRESASKGGKAKAAKTGR